MDDVDTIRRRLLVDWVQKVAVDVLVVAHKSSQLDKTCG
jgi:hypothetical protein